MKLLTNYNEFNQDLKNLNNEIRILLSHLIAIKNKISLIELRNTVIEIMKAIVDASDYTRTFLAKSKIGEWGESLGLTRAEHLGCVERAAATQFRSDLNVFKATFQDLKGRLQAAEQAQVLVEVEDMKGRVEDMRSKW